MGVVFEEFVGARDLLRKKRVLGFYLLLDDNHRLHFAFPQATFFVVFSGEWHVV